MDFNHLEHTKQMTMAMEKAYIEIENAKREATEKAQLNLAETQGDCLIPHLPLLSILGVTDSTFKSLFI